MDNGRTSGGAKLAMPIKVLAASFGLMIMFEIVLLAAVLFALMTNQNGEVRSLLAEASELLESGRSGDHEPALRAIRGSGDLLERGDSRIVTTIIAIAVGGSILTTLPLLLFAIGLRLLLKKYPELREER